MDSFLARHLRNYTNWRLQRLVAAGCARVNDETVTLARRVRRGEQVAIRLIEPPDKLLAPEPGPLKIVFEDPWLVVVDKPANLVAHPVASLQSGTLANRLQAHLDTQTPLKGLLRPGIVHRLDRMTSGLIVTTKHHLAHRRLTLSFQQGGVAKTYRALVRGVISEDSGTIDLPIGQRPNSILVTTGPDGHRYKPAVTRFRVVDRRSDGTMVDVVPETGRIHQIRVHFSAIGHPLWGDEFYGFEEPQGALPSSSRHALHASRLSFTHPVLNTLLDFQSALPPDLDALWTAAAVGAGRTNPVSL